MGEKGIIGACWHPRTGSTGRDWRRRGLKAKLREAHKRRRYDVLALGVVSPFRLISPPSPFFFASLLSLPSACLAATLLFSPDEHASREYRQAGQGVRSSSSTSETRQLVYFPFFFSSSRAFSLTPSSSACSTGGFYKSPTASKSLPYSSPIDITWDASCLSTSYVDIYLYAPGASTPRIHIWHNVYYPAGSYQTTFQPKWWNATSSVNLQLSIVPANTPPFQAPFPPGPIFTVTYQTPSSGGAPASADTSKPDGAITVVNNGPFTNTHTSGNKVAAAVVIPLLFIIFLVGVAYVRLRRQSAKEDRRRWSEAVDRRMSTISTDWKPISVAGAQAAIRNSIAADSTSRASSFSFGNIRPASIVVEGGQAGIGTRARTVLPGASNGIPQPRSSLATSQITAERVSRVSFAPDVRPSSERRHTVTSRAFHTAIIPPVPDRKWEDSLTPTLNSDHDESLSPTQTNGPETLSIEDIQAHLSGRETEHRPSVDAVMPALRCAPLFFSPFLFLV